MEKTKIYSAVIFVLGGLGVAFLIVSALMFLTGVGKKPLLAALIGIALYSTAALISSKALPKHPQCRSEA